MDRYTCTLNKIITLYVVILFLFVVFKYTYLQISQKYIIILRIYVYSFLLPILQIISVSGPDQRIV